MPVPQQAILFGATGLVGSLALSLLENDSSVDKIHLIARRQPLSSVSSKIIFHLSDLESVETLRDELKGSRPDFALCCLGTTMAKAGSQTNFYHVDHDLILNAGRVCRDIGVRAFGIVSSVGADPHARNFYLRVKGETERDLTALNFERLVILRPGVLLGERAEKRPLEKFAVTVFPLLNLFLQGPLKRYRGVPAQVVAKHLITETRRPDPGVIFVENCNLS